MKSDFEEIAGIATRIMVEAGAYREDEAPSITEVRVNWISGYARTIVGMAETMELELGESEEGLR